MERGRRPDVGVSCPMDALIREKPDLMVNIAASPFSHDHAEQRKAILLRNVKQYGIPLVYVNHVGAQTEIIFDSGSLAMDRTGTIVSEAAYFEEDLLLVSLENDGQLTATKATDITRSAPKEKIERIYRALVLVYAIISGNKVFELLRWDFRGIDSAVVTCLAADALGPENVKVLLMPSGFSSEGSVTDSLELIRANGVNHETIPIHRSLMLIWPHSNRPFPDYRSMSRKKTSRRAYAADYSWPNPTSSARSC